MQRWVCTAFLVSGLALEGAGIHTSASETARSDVSDLWQDLSAPLPLVGRGKGWGALSLQAFEK
ncbi:hypothetical protein APZ00_10090 [Pannonibacter phragmitetus]|uniref:Uncharacterized protein n=1 Tax=Pannonibacter phragmitetus TaxID=121719 RepID=A0A0U3P1B2_9HYPH|nr:hypothetical protein APZ00_10090 [Pannonibacter phragmitetus]